MAQPIPTSPAPTRPVSPTATDGSTAMQGDVTIWLDWKPARLASLSKAVSGFQSLHPDVHFNLVYIPTSQLQDAFIQAAANGSGPSLLIGPSSWAESLYQQGLIRDLSGLVSTTQSQRVYPSVWKQAANSTRVMGMPLAIEANLLYRNTSLVSTPAGTVTNLVNTAQALKAQRGFGASLDFGFLYAAPQIAACGGVLDTGATLPFSEATGECWLSLLKTLGSAGTPVFDSDQDLQAFEAGKSAWLIASSDRIDELAQAIGDQNLAVDPWPTVASTGGRLTGYIWSQNMYLTQSAGKRDADSSWAFMTYLLAPETQLAISQTPGARTLPAVTDLEITDPLLGQAELTLGNDLPLPSPASLARVQGPLETAVRLVVSQAGDVQFNMILALQEIEKANLATATPTATASLTPVTPLPEISPPVVPPAVTATPQLSGTPGSR